MRHPFITAQLLRHARTTIDAEPRKRPAQDAVPGRRVRRLLVVIAATLLVALVALGVPLPAGAAHARPTGAPGRQWSGRWHENTTPTRLLPSRRRRRPSGRWHGSTTPSLLPPASSPPGPSRPRRAGPARCWSWWVSPA